MLQNVDYKQHTNHNPSDYLYKYLLLLRRFILNFSSRKYKSGKTRRCPYCAFSSHRVSGFFWSDHVIEHNFILISQLVKLCHKASFDVKFVISHIMSFHVISCHFLSFHVISSHFISYYVISCISCHAGWHWTFLTSFQYSREGRSLSLNGVAPLHHMCKVKEAEETLVAFLMVGANCGHIFLYRGFNWIRKFTSPA
jgi:hypothetical protein